MNFLTVLSRVENTFIFKNEGTIKLKFYSRNDLAPLCNSFAKYLPHLPYFVIHALFTSRYSIYLHTLYLNIFAFDLLHLPLFFLTQKILSKSAYLLIGQPFFCSYFWMTHFFMVLQSQGGPSNFRWISEEGVLVLYDDSAVSIRGFIQKIYLN